MNGSLRGNDGDHSRLAQAVQTGSGACDPKTNGLKLFAFWLLDAVRCPTNGQLRSLIQRRERGETLSHRSLIAAEWN